MKPFFSSADEFAGYLEAAGYRQICFDKSTQIRWGEYRREMIFSPKPSQGIGIRRRLWRLNFAFPGKIAIEVVKRGTKVNYKKQNAAVFLGWRIFYVTPKMVSNGEGVHLVKSVV